MDKKYKIEKGRVVRKEDGKVAVACSPDFGAGWVTWNKGISPFEPKVIEMILNNEQNEIDEVWCYKNNILNANELPYCGGTSCLEIVWLPKGTKFRIAEYDGSEDIIIKEDLVFKT